MSGTGDPRQRAHDAAFADGRRLRDQARRRSPAGAALPRHPTSGGALLVLLLTLLITVGTAALVVVTVGTAVFGEVFTPVVPILVVLGMLHVVTGPRRHRRAVAVAGAATVTAAPPDTDWSAAHARFGTLRETYAAHECDALAVLRLPALSDVAVPSTARFVDAFAHAQALETDELPPPEHATAFARAVEQAERAWRAAVDAAERIRHSRLSPEERRSIERVVKLLTTARDSPHDPERHAAYALARAELDKLDRAGVVHLPRPAALALDEAARGALPA